MSKVAICYSGQARSAKHLYENHIFHVIRKFAEPSIFVSVADDAQADDMLLLRDALPNVPFFFEKVVQPEIDEPIERTKWHSGCPRASSVQGILKQLWGWERSWTFLKELANPDDFTAFVRIRCDSCFMGADLPSLDAITPHTCLSVWWSRWSQVNDRFAILGRRAAEAYFDTFAARHSLWTAGCPVHPETMLNFQLRRSGIKPSHDLNVTFSTLRTDGKIDPLTATPIDIAEYARRKP